MPRLAREEASSTPSSRRSTTAFMPASINLVYSLVAIDPEMAILSVIHERSNIGFPRDAIYLGQITISLRLGN